MAFGPVSIDSSGLLADDGAERLAEFVKLFEHLLVDCLVPGFLFSFRMIDLVLEVVEEVNGPVDDLCRSLVVLIRVESVEKKAVVDELADEVLEIFFDDSKVHIELI